MPLRAPAPSGHPVRVFVRDRQEQWHARRVLGANESTPGFRAGSCWSGGTTGSCRSLPTGRRPGRRPATSVTSRTTATSAPTGWSGRTARRSKRSWEHKQRAAPVRVELRIVQHFRRLEWPQPSWGIALEEDVIAGGEIPTVGIRPGGQAAVGLPDWQAPPADGREARLTLGPRTCPRRRGRAPGSSCASTPHIVASAR